MQVTINGELHSLARVKEAERLSLQLRKRMTSKFGWAETMDHRFVRFSTGNVGGVNGGVKPCHCWSAPLGGQVKAKASSL